MVDFLKWDQLEEHTAVEMKLRETLQKALEEKDIMAEVFNGYAELIEDMLELMSRFTPRQPKQAKEFQEVLDGFNQRYEDISNAALLGFLNPRSKEVH